jgi:hypothetical protein
MSGCRSWQLAVGGTAPKLTARVIAVDTGIARIFRGSR